MKYYYLVHPGFVFEDEDLIAVFEKKVEAESHAAARLAAGENNVHVTPIPFFSGEHPASTLLFFQSAELRGGQPISHSRWSNIYWHYQSKPPTTRKARVSKNYANRVVVEGTDQEAVRKLLIKKVKEMQKEANV